MSVVDTPPIIISIITHAGSGRRSEGSSMAADHGELSWTVIPRPLYEGGYHSESGGTAASRRLSSSSFLLVDLSAATSESRVNHQWVTDNCEKLSSSDSCVVFPLSLSIAAVQLQSGFRCSGKTNASTNMCSQSLLELFSGQWVTALKAEQPHAPVQHFLNLKQNFNFIIIFLLWNDSCYDGPFCSVISVVIVCLYRMHVWWTDTSKHFYGRNKWWMVSINVIPFFNEWWYIHFIIELILYLIW